jgi:hypothetical protein
MFNRATSLHPARLVNGDTVGVSLSTQPALVAAARMTWVTSISVLYVGTVHHDTPKWIDIQHEYLHRYISVPFRTFAVLSGIARFQFRDKFTRILDCQGSHSGKLNLLAAEICNEAQPSDIILFIDGDAFPIADPMGAICEALQHTSLLAVRRDENLGDRQPHPCFCAIRVSEWQRLHGDWSPGYSWINDQGEALTDVGGNLLAALERNNCSWTPLLRSNRLNIHPVLFAVYGDIVYHHGAGFRRPTTRFDNKKAKKGEDVAALSDKWFERLQEDPSFLQDMLSGRNGSPIGDSAEDLDRGAAH